MPTGLEVQINEVSGDFASNPPFLQREPLLDDSECEKLPTGNIYPKKCFQSGFTVYLCALNFEDMVSFEERDTFILRETSAIFMAEGVRNVTMDHVAKELKISKKTLYLHVRNKSDLVRRCVEWSVSRVKGQLKAIADLRMNAVEENLAFSYMVINELKNVHAGAFRDLNEYFPEAFEVLDEMRFSFVANLVQNNMQRGIEEGFYRSDLNVPIMTRLWVLRLNLVIEPSDLTGEFALSDIYREMVFHHIRGIVSEKGLKYITDKNPENISLWDTRDPLEIQDKLSKTPDSGKADKKPKSTS